MLHLGKAPIPAQLYAPGVPAVEAVGARASLEDSVHGRAVLEALRSE